MDKQKREANVFQALKDGAWIELTESDRYVLRTREDSLGAVSKPYFEFMYRMGYLVSINGESWGHCDCWKQPVIEQTEDGFLRYKKDENGNTLFEEDGAE